MILDRIENRDSHNLERDLYEKRVATFSQFSWCEPVPTSLERALSGKIGDDGIEDREAFRADPEAAPRRIFDHALG